MKTHKEKILESFYELLRKELENSELDKKLFEYILEEIVEKCIISDKKEGINTNDVAESLASLFLERIKNK